MWRSQSWLLIKLVNSTSISDWILKALKLRKLLHSAFIYVINAFMSFCTDTFLVISQNHASKFSSLEKVLSLVGSFWNCEYFFSLIRSFTLSTRIKFELECLFFNLILSRWCKCGELGRVRLVMFYSNKLWSSRCNRTYFILKVFITLILSLIIL